MSISVSRHLSQTALLLFLVNSLAAAESRVLIPNATTTWRHATDKPGDNWTKADFDDGKPHDATEFDLMRRYGENFLSKEEEQ